MIVKREVYLQMLVDKMNNGFRSETLEKVLRLIDVLDYISKTDELSDPAIPEYLKVK